MKGWIGGWVGQPVRGDVLLQEGIGGWVARWAAKSGFRADAMRLRTLFAHVVPGKAPYGIAAALHSQRGLGVLHA